MSRLLSFVICLFISQATCVSFAQYSVNVENVNVPVKSGHHRMGHPGPKGQEIIINNLYMTVGGKPVLPVMGEFHFERYDKRYWRDVLQKMKAGGVDIASVYLLWMYHEEIENEIDFTGNNDIREFLRICKEENMKAHLRIGPYCNAECRNGGRPDWSMKRENMRTRYNDPMYLQYARRLYSHYAEQMKGYYYKDGGPIMAIQLENEYVEPGHVVPHMMELKKIAVECGIDVPIYSMTHWMSSDYPKNEIIPYAGYYIELPWDASTKKLPPSDYLYFSYNRLSDNIGTDLIKKSDNINTLDASEYESPYFTCEVGLGNQITAHRRPILDAASAGANINLRLGCGVSLMGYYMYSGGSHRIGELTSTHSPICSRITYDFMAPLSEYGEITPMYKEVKKYNYLMNDFGEELATSIACLPVSNQDTSNLQWSVRVNGDSGFLFCSNYQRVWNRREYKNVRFSVKMKGETLTIPSKPIKVMDKAYFMWPFNQTYEGVLLKYATAQPICKIKDEQGMTYFFYEDDGIPAEYVFDRSTIENITAKNGEVAGKKNDYTINKIIAGKDNLIEITGKNGKRVRFITLTATESDNLWREKIGGKEYAFITTDGIKLQDGQVVLYGEHDAQELLVYPAVSDIQSSMPGSYKGNEGMYARYLFSHDKKEFKVSTDKISMLSDAKWITSDNKDASSLTKRIFIREGMPLHMAQLRVATSSTVKITVNGTEITQNVENGYCLQDIKKYLKTGDNKLEFNPVSGDLRLLASLEVEYEKGLRHVYVSDGTWFAGDIKHPAKVLGNQGDSGLPVIDTSKELFAYYRVNIPENFFSSDAVARMKIDYSGNFADCFIGEQLRSDNSFNGLTYTIGIDRFRELLSSGEMIIRIKAFEKMPNVYFEDFIDISDCTVPKLKNIVIRPEYASLLSFK